MGMPDPDGHGASDGLPDLPPEWGRLVVPDDASALAAEAEQVRRELRAARRPHRRRLSSRLALPLLVLAVAVLTTLAGLVTVTWPRTDRSSRPTVPTAAPPVGPTGPVGRPLPALDLVDDAQAPVPLRGLLPAAIVLVDACACPERVAEAVVAAPPGVRVVTVTGGRTVAPDPVAPGVRRLADPAGGLRALIGAAPVPGTVSLLLVDRAGTVVRVVPTVGSTEDYRRDLVHLAD
ncbi:hypothetical protein O7606_22260 [Micromonospora sp. WMMD882]|uniref:hypothetical protein n=1 Tax=Micromonospora sp. WMMD882 TaxID=3015151 RepID=UPI00248B4A6E|nr:hypothetical protein [Micromonospora sp. WMMD882]WBB78896.1 hypothetical protein O7606_22260 [Micromonospora sp. WMMD882]